MPLGEIELSTSCTDASNNQKRNKTAKKRKKKRGKSSNQKAILKSFEAKPFCLILEKLMRKAVC